jgi:hypothetical protein
VAAPEPDWSLPAPGLLAQVAALSNTMTGWAGAFLRDGPPMSLPRESLEPLAAIAASITPFEAPAISYRLVSLDPLSRHLRPDEPQAGDAPRSGARPTPQATEASEPLPAALSAPRGSVAALSGAPTPDAVVARHARAANPLRFPEREDLGIAQVIEPTEPLPPLLERTDPIPSALFRRDGRDEDRPRRPPAAFRPFRRVSGRSRCRPRRPIGAAARPTCRRCA